MEPQSKKPRTKSVQCCCDSKERLLAAIHCGKLNETLEWDLIPSALQRNSEILLAITEQPFFQHDRHFDDNVEFALNPVCNNGLLLMNLSPQLQGDAKIVLAALAQNPLVQNMISAEAHHFRVTRRKQALALVQCDGTWLNHLWMVNGSEDFSRDPDVFVAMVGQPLFHCPERLRTVEQWLTHHCNKKVM